MARLFRPHIPIAVKIDVAQRQLRAASAALWDEYCAVAVGEPNWIKLGLLQAGFAAALGCEAKDLRLDHDPPLGARQKRGEGKRTVYTPAANDPAHLFYRPHGAEYDGSHDIKTRVRGDHGQYSDIALIKRQRRRERPPKAKRKWASRPFPKRPSALKRRKR